MPSGGHFVPRRTTRLTPGEVNDFDVIKIAKALETTKEEIVGIQARFGGKAFDITWINEEIAGAAASTGLDFAGRHYELRLLGRKNLDVSVFVACEFPDEYLVELLRQYGEFNETSIRRLKLKERGYEHIENGVRVVSFSSMDRPLPNSVVYRNTALGFRYTGQVKLCFKCASPDHTVRDCPKNRIPTPEQQQQTEPEQSEQTTSETDHESNGTDNESNYETDRHETSEGESDMETQNETQPKAKRPKRPRTSSPGHSDSDQPAQKIQIDEEPQPTTQEQCTATIQSTDTAKTTQDAATAPKSTRSSGPRQKKFLEAIKSPGKARQALMAVLKPAESYYKARGLWLQHQHGDHSAESVRINRVNNSKDVAEWRTLAGMIRQDAFGNLLRLYNEITEVCDIFPTN